MSNYRIAWLPGDGIGPEVCDAARLVLDAAGFQADYLHGDIGWDSGARRATRCLRAPSTCCATQIALFSER